MSLMLLCTACTSSEAEATPSPSPEDVMTSDTFKEASQYDYQDYSDSQGIDENGMFTGVRALDYVTLPENYDRHQGRHCSYR